jgi:hypothetical protein
MHTNGEPHRGLGSTTARLVLVVRGARGLLSRAARRSSIALSNSWHITSFRDACPTSCGSTARTGNRRGMAHRDSPKPVGVDQIDLTLLKLSKQVTKTCTAQVIHALQGFR